MRLEQPLPSTLSTPSRRLERLLQVRRLPEYLFSRYLEDLGFNLSIQDIRVKINGKLNEIDGIQDSEYMFSILDMVICLVTEKLSDLAKSSEEDQQQKSEMIIKYMKILVVLTDMIRNIKEMTVFDYFPEGEQNYYESVVNYFSVSNKKDLWITVHPDLLTLRILEEPRFSRFFETGDQKQREYVINAIRGFLLYFRIIQGNHIFRSAFSSLNELINFNTINYSPNSKSANTSRDSLEELYITIFTILFGDTGIYNLVKGQIDPEKLDTPQQQQTQEY